MRFIGKDYTNAGRRFYTTNASTSRIFLMVGAFAQRCDLSSSHPFDFFKKKTGNKKNPEATKTQMFWLGCLEHKEAINPAAPWLVSPVSSVSTPWASRPQRCGSWPSVPAREADPGGGRSVRSVRSSLQWHVALRHGMSFAVECRSIASNGLVLTKTALSAAWLDGSRSTRETNECVPADRLVDFLFTHAIALRYCTPPPMILVQGVQLEPGVSKVEMA